MADLPVCRLCECSAHKNADRATCSNRDCEIYGHFFDCDNWRKLMYVPAKIAYDRVGDELFRRRNEGYNAAIDDMLRGWE